MTDRFCLEDETFLFKILTMYVPLKIFGYIKKIISCVKSGRLKGKPPRR